MPINPGDHIVIPIGTPCSPEQQLLNDRALAASFKQTSEIIGRQCAADDRLDHMARALCWASKHFCHNSGCASVRRCVEGSHAPRLLIEARAAIVAADEWKENT